MSHMRSFVKESNRIEGIDLVLNNELDATAEFLKRETPTVDGLCDYVSTVAGALLRDKHGMDVRVGSHRPPPGGPYIAPALDSIVAEAAGNLASPFDVHRRFETLHPFTDGNGRSGRLLWAWQMLHYDIRPRLKLGFLHAWYYQSLDTT